MKKSLLLICLLGSIENFAQVEYIPTGAKWVYDCTHYTIFGDRNHFNLICETEKDTIINGKSSRKLHRYFKDKDANNNIQIVELNPAYFYQEGSRIYQFYKDSFHFYFDFEVKSIGDTFLIDGEKFPDQSYTSFSPVNFILKQIKTENYNGFDFRTFTLEAVCGGFQEPELIINEKLGPLNNMLFPFRKYCIIDYAEGYKLKCYSDPVVGEINVAGIPCDSIRPDVLDNEDFPSDKTKNRISVYPSVIENKIAVERHDQPDVINEGYFSLIRSDGVPVYSQKINFPKSELDLINLQTGMYIYYIKENKKILASGKLVKMQL